MTKALLVLFLACAAAAYADTWHIGNLTTHGQADWGGDPSSTSRFTMTFTDASSVLAYIALDRSTGAST